MSQVTGRVLIIDDEPPLLKMMSTYLGRLGHAVTTANTTEQAWQEVEAAPLEFALAVLDATMPGITMEDLVTRMLRANPALSVVIASGYPVEMSAMEAAAPGRVSFLHKPFTPEMLAACVRRMLGPKEEE